MKKGFTLVEIIIVLAILGILIAITNINFVRLSQKSKLDSAANDIAAMVKEVYEKSNNEMDYTKWKIEIKRGSSNYNISIINNGQVVRSIELQNAIMEFNDGNVNLSVDTVNLINFASNGNIVFKNNALNNEFINFNIKLTNSSNSEIYKTIEIKSTPPGYVIIK
ncbi:hypothetical protein ABG79_00247 [Caloramator mitchellensis]|uniref:Prepilin-type N-terminal cleavage/methylation domain-containing protein n=1 Tax=Caloramator mitchellensis TaxID=908809 RepID=A0A0R3JWY0_CALMK|nr:prepilin-type N-terminal cleavage/methylation domain-containing protein [Caloramator mitchellensis]KRQ88080.1 hypothetical protein ABG79_00247 [Caloramator mitchellensis]